MDLNKRIGIKIIFIFLLCFSIQITAQQIKHINGIAIYSRDGTKISANVYMPFDNQHKWPLIIMPNSWGLDEYEYSLPAQNLAKKGYIVLSYSARGWGKSEGSVNVASPNDLDDIDAIITWALNELPGDPQHIGMAGISYGGGLSLLAATHDPRIKAVAVMSAWSDLIDSLYSNNSPSKLWGSLLVQSGSIIGRLDPEVKKQFQNLLHHINMDGVIAWAKVRSPVNFIDKLNSNQTAVYISQNLGDRLFRPNMMLYLFERLKTAKRMDLNQGIHASAEVPGLLGFDNYVWDQAYKWFDHWLKGVDNGIDKSPYISIEIKKGKRIVAEQWPITTENKQFYLQNRPNFLLPGKLSAKGPGTNGSNKLNFGLFTGINSGLPIVSPILNSHLEIPIITWLPGINHLSAIYYQTKPLKGNFTIIGIPHITLWYRSSIQQSQIIAYLYDVDIFGFGQLISHAPVSRYHNIPGNYVVSEFDLAMTAHQVRKGHRLALAFGTYDLLYAPPAMVDYTMQIAYGHSMDSHIVIPFVTTHHD